MPDFTENDLRDIERVHDLPPDELADTHRYCPDEEGLCRYPAFADECPNVEQEEDEVSSAPDDPVIR